MANLTCRRWLKVGLAVSVDGHFWPELLRCGERAIDGHLLNGTSAAVTRDRISWAMR